MWKFLLICILFWVCVTSQTESKFEDNENLIEKFADFVVKYNRQYKNEKEKALRFSNFIKNVKKSAGLNKLYGEKQFGITKFSDWSEEELKGMLGYRPVKNANAKSQVPLQKINQGQAPASWDWRKKNAVTPAKDQGNCGSCWAFSAIGNIEGQYAIKHNKLVSLSVQELVDCATNHSKNDNNGCDGGETYLAFEDLVQADELVESEKAYPYKAANGVCNYHKQDGVAKLIGYNTINSTNEEELKQALYQYGPLSFAMASDYLDFWLGGGILPGCPPGARKDHALLLVGYGTTGKGEKYWIVKNSWGADWNGDGFFKMKMVNNSCDIMEAGNIVTSQVA